MAPPAPKLIPKGRYGVSVWVEILLDKYFGYRPTERLLGSWRLWDLDLAPGTVTDGLQRLEVLLRPIYQALQERNRQGDLHQADETRWPVFVVLEGKEGYGWWLWVFLGPDTVVFVLNVSRGHEVPEDHYQAESRGVLVVDRYSAYKAMSWVKEDPSSWLSAGPMCGGTSSGWAKDGRDRRRGPWNGCGGFACSTG